MHLNYRAEVLADSLSPEGVRLTTFHIVFPRCLLAEVNTHRMLSRNSASSRAVPPEKVIEAVKAAPFVPQFYERVKGMGAGRPLRLEAQREAEHMWLCARDRAVVSAEAMAHIDKAHVNRMLEPYMWHSCIITGTDWFNFFALRCPPGEPDPEFSAQIEFQQIAKYMLNAMRTSQPVDLDYGEWHLPLVADSTREEDAWISAGRCARVSYYRHEDEEPTEKTRARAEQLMVDWHLSPFEHPACPMNGDPEYEGPLRGWMSLRKMMPNENSVPEVMRPDLADIL